jgi:hypothetical protein
MPRLAVGTPVLVRDLDVMGEVVEVWPAVPRRRRRFVVRVTSTYADRSMVVRDRSQLEPA